MIFIVGPGIALFIVGMCKILCATRGTWRMSGDIVRTWLDAFRVTTWSPPRGNRVIVRREINLESARLDAYRAHRAGRHMSLTLEGMPDVSDHARAVKILARLDPSDMMPNESASRETGITS